MAGMPLPAGGASADGWRFRVFTAQAVVPFALAAGAVRRGIPTTPHHQPGGGQTIALCCRRVAAPWPGSAESSSMVQAPGESGTHASLMTLGNFTYFLGRCGQSIFGSDIYKIDVGMPKEPLMAFQSAFEGAC